MGWFAVDDGFDNHPKIRKAGNAAAGLFCRLGAYSSRSASEGVIPGPVARDYGTTAQLRKLADLGMLHPHGHTCKECAQPEPGGFVMHDYLDYNRSRAEIENARKAGAERQRRRRERLAAEAAAAETGASTGVSGGVAPGVAGEPSGGVAGEPPVSGKRRRSQGPVTADAAGERARTNPAQPPVLLPLEEEPASHARGIPFIGDRPRIHPPCIPLVQAMTDAGLVVGWELEPTEWLILEAIVLKCPTAHLVAAAREMWAKARTRPRSGNYFIPGWKALPAIPEGTPLAPAVGDEPPRGGYQPHQQPDASAFLNQQGF